MRWNDGSKEGVYSGDLLGLGRTSTLSYDGHTFFFMLRGEEVARFKMNRRKCLHHRTAPGRSRGP